MQGTQPPTFRPTVWPAEPPRPPAVTRYRLEPVAADDVGLRVTQALGTFELPPDFVFRELLERVPATTTEVVEVAAAWGLTNGSGARAFEYLAGDPPPDVLSDLQAWQDAGLSGLLNELLHPGAVLAHLAALRALARHLLAYLEGQGDSAILGAWQGVAAPSSVHRAWWLWEWYVNRGLTVFAVHVRAEPTVPDKHRLTRPVPNLYNACCLQLANYLAGDVPVLRCANERCRRPFTRQRGRAREEYGQHRSRGVRYCSHLCAKAQSERDRRRRRAEECQA